MKRVGILLAIFFVLVIIGSRMNSADQSSPAKTAEPTKVAEVKPKTPTEKKTQQEKWFGSETVVAAKRAVKNSLKDPDSAEFKDVYANYTEKHGVVACGYVNAKNSLGGYTGYKAFVSSGQSVIMEGRDNIKDAWRGACK